MLDNHAIAKVSHTYLLYLLKFLIDFFTLIELKGIIYEKD